MFPLRSRLKLYWEFARPFTLMPPALGMITGALTALGADPKNQSDWIDPGWLLAGRMEPAWLKLTWYIAVGAIMAALLNVASNALNQITDQVNDRINKPDRPIPSGRISITEARIMTILAGLAALVSSFLVNWQCFIIVCATAFIVYFYSAEPLRTKKRGWLANLTIAVPRGVLLTVAGWSCVKSVFTVEPWYIGMIFGLFLLGASSTKDFPDIKGDAKAGCRTLPVRYGIKAASRMIAPFFIWPFLLIPLGAYWGVLTGNPTLLTILGITLSVWGCYTVYHVLKDPEGLAESQNHISWKHMYLMMMTMQLGFAIAYLI